MGRAGRRRLGLDRVGDCSIPAPWVPGRLVGPGSCPQNRRTEPGSVCCHPPPPSQALNCRSQGSTTGPPAGCGCAGRNSRASCARPRHHPRQSRWQWEAGAEAPVPSVPLHHPTPPPLPSFAQRGVHACPRGPLAAAWTHGARDARGGARACSQKAHASTSALRAPPHGWRASPP